MPTDFPYNWDEIRNAILLRDDFTCLRCDKKYKKADLSVHHMVPREDGGTSSLSNLVTLCHDCHDYVEVNDLRSRAAIMGSFEDPADKKADEKPEEKKDKDEKLTWQEIVYGGQKKRW
jgi:5-methylcytosine-specific restriction endonuclease McrA